MTVMTNSNAIAPKAREILDAAEIHMRRGGYDAVSFRDLASEVGIKSASVHYHFPQKADLAKKLVERYTEQMLEFMGDPAHYKMSSAMARVIELYQGALNSTDSVCLCCILGTEAQTLPEPVSKAVEAYFAQLLDWLRISFDNSDPSQGHRKLAAFVVSSLQGAMSLAIATKNPEHFANTAEIVALHVRTEEMKLSLFSK